MIINRKLLLKLVEFMLYLEAKLMLQKKRSKRAKIKIIKIKFYAFMAMYSLIYFF